MPGRPLSRRRVLQGLAAGAGLATLGGPAAFASGRRPTRLPGAFGGAGDLRPPGSRPDPSRPEGIDTMPEIEHIVIYMQENHSYDQYFGMLGRGDGFTLDAAGRPTNSNPDRSGKPVMVFPMPSTCDLTQAASQSWDGSHLSVNGGAMDGFVTSAGGTGSMGYWDGTTLPFYYGLANTFPICDRWFSSVPAQTFPNRRYLQAATSLGIVSTDVNEVLATPDAPNGLIWDRLDAHGITWNDYAWDLADILLFPNFYAANKSHVQTFNQFLLDCEHGTLPQVSIVSPGDNTYTEENPADIQNGEAYSASIINAVMAGPLWPKTAMFFMYDEHGGAYDHVPPPAAVAPDSIKPRIHVPPDQPGGFDQYGVRVPGFVISPFAKADYVSHVVHDHTSVLKFIETKWNLGALTYRDANADDLLDCFDFANPGFREPPTLPAPGLPPGGSTCQKIPPPPTRGVAVSTTTTSTTTAAAPPTTSGGGPVPAPVPAPAPSGPTFLARTGPGDHTGPLAAVGTFGVLAGVAAVLAARDLERRAADRPAPDPAEP